jgi:hypothetical protein
MGESGTVRNTTVAENLADYGGGLLTDSSTTVVQNCTVVGNSASFSGGGMWLYSGTLTVQSTIAAQNGNGDVINYGFGTLNVDHSLVQDMAFPNGTNEANVYGQDPRLGPLSDNGGPTRTYPLTPGSPALDAGSNPANLGTDQRGEARVQNGVPDIGAVEGTSPFAVTNLDDTGPAACGKPS